MSDRLSLPSSQRGPAIARWGCCMRFSAVARLSFLILISCCPGLAETRSGAISGSIAIGSGSIAGITNFDTPGLLRQRVVPGQPYSADRVSEHSQTLADGTHIQQNREVSREYRDS